MHCNVCHTKLDSPIYEAPTEQALTSLCELRSGKVRVWQCLNCGHLRGEALEDTADYYESDYRILLDHEEEDQVYEVQGEQIIYRTDHQAETLLSKLDLPIGAQVLDYGCAKAAMPRRLIERRSDLKMYLFDVSSMYRPFWEKLVPTENWAIHQTPENWLGRFDVITSFFALEHIPAPLDTVRHIAELLAKDGVFYGIVPDTFGNFGDFVVIDHVNHFTEQSLYALLRTAGFVDITIDAGVHRGALVFTARKNGRLTEPPVLEASLVAGRQLAEYWNGLGDRLRKAENTYAGLPAAIYGSGFYGAYIVSLLRNPDRVECFLDASPFQQGKMLFGHPIIPPEEFPHHIRLLYVGLNPKIARDAVSGMHWLTAYDVVPVFLD